MADGTLIEWSDATWNPVTGCTKVSPGCAHCYAERLAPRVFAGQTVPCSACRGTGGGDLPCVSCASTGSLPRRFTDVRFHPERLDAPLHWRKPKRVFVNSMSDLFHEDVPDEFIVAVFEVMARCPQHTFQILTKRPERMRELLADDDFWTAVEAGMGPDERGPWPLPNVWLGVSVEDQRHADERIPVLLDTPAAVRFLSCEPLLGPVDLSAWIPPIQAHVLGGPPRDWTQEASAALREVIIAAHRRMRGDEPSIDWLIVGGESGPKARPMDLAWARSLVEQGRAAGVPVFVKQDSGPRASMQGRFTDAEWAIKEFPRAS